MIPSDSEKQQWAKELSLSLEEFEVRVSSLCRRLSIRLSRLESFNWTELFFHLLRQQREFKKPKRGRPKSKGPSIDYRRFMTIKKLRHEKQKQVAGGKAVKITDKALIKELFDSSHELFLDIKDATQSVSDGRRIFKKEQARAARLRKENQETEAELDQQRHRELLKEIRELRGPVGLGREAPVGLGIRRKSSKN